MHQPVRGSVEYEPDLIGDRAVCAHITQFQGVTVTNFPKGPF
jgi:hypothetical protein